MIGKVAVQYIPYVYLLVRYSIYHKGIYIPTISDDLLSLFELYIVRELLKYLQMTMLKHKIFGLKDLKNETLNGLKKAGFAKTGNYYELKIILRKFII